MKTEDRYYYLGADKKPVGPFSYEEMLRLASVGRIESRTPAAREGQLGWKEWSRLSLDASPRAASALPSAHADGDLPAVPGSRPPAGAPKTPLPAPRAAWGRGSKALAATVAGLVLLFLVALLLVNLRRTAPSLANDEIQSLDKLKADFAQWSRAQDAVNRDGVAALAPPPLAGDPKISWWQRTFELPHEKSVRAALERRLSPDAGLRGFEPVRVARSPEGVAVDYRVHLRLASAMYLCPVEDLQLAQPALAKYKKLAKYLVASDDLPAGKRFALDQKRLLAPKGTDLQLPWAIRRAVVQDGKWKVLDAEPLALGRSPVFEQVLLDPERAAFVPPRASELSPRTSPVPAGNRAPVWLVRSEEELRRDAAREDAEFQALAARARAIEDELAQLRQRLAADLPAIPSKDTAKFGGSGSGEPTKTGVRVGGGAAAGAGIGALAGGGSGAGWGALGGAVAGGVYDAVSKSNDRKRLEAAQEREYQGRLSAYNAAKKRADAQVAAREAELLSRLEQELQAKARQQAKF
jgi:surface antigen